jgi:transcription-repair coupling factor (superfamily II helicase)
LNKVLFGESAAETLAVLTKGAGAGHVHGVMEGSDAWLAGEVSTRRNSIVVFVARDEMRVSTIEAQLAFFAPSVPRLRVPAWDCTPYDRMSPSVAVAAQRSGALALLAGYSGGPLVVVTSAAALTQRSAPKSALAEATLSFKTHQQVHQKVLDAYLLANGFTRASTVRAPGEFAIRGGVIDVYPPSATDPVRLDLFGDALESLKTFDPETQRSTGTLNEFHLSPVSEVQLGDEALAFFRQSYVGRFGVAAGGDPVAEAVRSRIRSQGVEHLLPLFHAQLGTILDFVPQDALVLVDHLAEDACQKRYESAVEHFQSRSEPSPVRGAVPFRGTAPDELYLSPSALAAVLSGRQTVRLHPGPRPDGVTGADLGARPVRSFAIERNALEGNVFEAAADYVRSRMGQGRKVLLAAWSDGSAERLGGVLEDHGLQKPELISSLSAVDAAGGTHPLVAVLPLEQGFEAGPLTLLSEQDLLGERLSRPRRKRRPINFIAEAASLSPGDLVVHVDHGIGRYVGLRTLDVTGAPHDCLELIYLGDDKLYLPVENIDLVTRYGTDDGINLDKLGGAAWQGRKARAKKRLRDMAEALIRMAAERASQTAEPLEAPEGLYAEFCARFPYDETDDQLSAIEDVIGDLASGKPTDRLICGDVGFGKTEVALRAAFVAAMSGLQVAIIAPTTLLARQHYRQFQERFRGFPIKVGHLSRMATAPEVAAAKAGINDGTLDIVVATHAVLAKGIDFKRLGLVVVDEEQHFGVKHKERLKELKSDIHVITLSATPIPRTLQLALSGIREMSIIATPPVDRMAVRTYVTPFDGATVREALLRERYRGGQSFVVAPRISDLADIEKALKLLTPELRVATAHGQMGSTALEELMTEFYDGAFDVLLSTSIVESGLDIPRANTLIVYRADMFGLAQLYQLRGRVGRSKVRAYAFLTTQPDKPITDGADKRLRVLQSLDTLGAGFQLASHDLDMRGGGNLLGEEQSGHIREVGVELYQQMLEEAVAALREGRAEVDREWSPQINVGAAVMIPETWVPDLTVRLSLYRRLADLATEAEREAFAAELVDRFGAMPPEARHLFTVAGLKAACKACHIGKLDAGPKGASLSFRETGFPDLSGLIRLVASRPFDLKLRPDGKLIYTADMGEEGMRLTRIKALLGALSDVAAAPKEAA